MKIILSSVSAVASQLQLHFQTRLQYPIAQRISTFIATHQQRSLHNVVLHQHRIVHLASRIAHYIATHQRSLLCIAYCIVHRASSRIAHYIAARFAYPPLHHAAALNSFWQQFRSNFGSNVTSLARRSWHVSPLHVAPGTSLLARLSSVTSLPRPSLLRTSLLARLLFAFVHHNDRKQHLLQQCESARTTSINGTSAHTLPSKFLRVRRCTSKKIIMSARFLSTARI